MTKTKRLGAVLCCVLMIVMVLGAFAVSAASVTFLNLSDGPIVIDQPGDYTIMGNYDGSAEAAIWVQADANITLASVGTQEAALWIGNPHVYGVYPSIDVTVTLVGTNNVGSVSINDDVSYSNDTVTVNGSGTLRVAGDFYVAEGGVLYVDNGELIVDGIFGGYNSGRGVGTIYLNGGTVEANSIQTGTAGDLYIYDGAKVFTNGISIYYGDLYIYGGAYVETGSITQMSTAGGVLYISPDATVVYI